MTCPIKGCPQPEHGSIDWRMAGQIADQYIRHVLSMLDEPSKYDQVRPAAVGLIHAAPDTAHALVELVRAAERVYRTTTDPTDKIALGTALDHGIAALAKARGE